MINLHKTNDFVRDENKRLYEVLVDPETDEEMFIEVNKCKKYR